MIRFEKHMTTETSILSEGISDAEFDDGVTSVAFVVRTDSFSWIHALNSGQVALWIQIFVEFPSKLLVMKTRILRMNEDYSGCAEFWSSLWAANFCQFLGYKSLTSCSDRSSGHVI
jgi:hypothetical protein